MLARHGGEFRFRRCLHDNVVTSTSQFQIWLTYTVFKEWADCCSCCVHKLARHEDKVAQNVILPAVEVLQQHSCCKRAWRCSYQVKSCLHWYM